MLTRELSVIFIKKIRRHDFVLFKRSDGIIESHTNDNAFFTLAVCKEFVAALKEITNGIPHLILMIPGRHTCVDKFGRSYMASDEALQYTIAQAALELSMPQRIFNNLYLSVDKPVKPTRFFKDRDEAISWLRTQAP